MKKHQVQTQIREKRSAAQKIIEGIPVSRDMTPDEKAQVDTLIKDVESLKGRLDMMEATEPDDDEHIAARAKELAESGRYARRTRPIGPAPSAHNDTDTDRGYSYFRALNLVADGRQVDGLEGEVSREIEVRTGRKPKGFFLPTGQDPVIRSMMYPGRGDGIRRDLTTSTGVGGIFNVPELPLIELLRAKLVVKQLGARVMSDVQGTFSIPRQSGPSTVFWLGEGNNATPSNPTLDQVPFTPKVAIALVTLTRQFMNQTSIDAEQFVKDDLAETMAREIDRVAINGSGGTQPLGILQNSTIVANSAGLAIGTNGGPITFGKVVAMESQVAGYNADAGKLAYLTNPKLRGSLKQTAKVATGASATGYPIFLYEDGTEAGVGQINGYPARATTNVPSNLSKGSGTNLSAIIYGDWSSLIIAQWEGVDVLVNPYSLQASGGVIISTEMSMDCQVRHPESFAIITDATP